MDAVARVAPHPRREVVASAIATTAIATATGTGTATATATATGIATATGADEGRCFGEGLVGGQRVGTGLADADAPRRQGGQEPLHGGAREELGEARHGHGHAPDVLRVRQHVLLRRGALQRVSARHGHAAAGAHAQEHRVDETHRRAAAPRRRFRFQLDHLLLTPNEQQLHLALLLNPSLCLGILRCRLKILIEPGQEIPQLI